MVLTVTLYLAETLLNHLVTSNPQPLTFVYYVARYVTYTARSWARNPYLRGYGIGHVPYDDGKRLQLIPEVD